MERQASAAAAKGGRVPAGVADTHLRAMPDGKLFTTREVADACGCGPTAALYAVRRLMKRGGVAVEEQARRGRDGQQATYKRVRREVEPPPRPFRSSSALPADPPADDDDEGPPPPLSLPKADRRRPPRAKGPPADPAAAREFNGRRAAPQQWPAAPSKPYECRPRGGGSLPINPQFAGRFTK